MGQSRHPLSIDGDGDGPGGQGTDDSARSDREIRRGSRFRHSREWHAVRPATAAQPIYFTTSYDDTVGGDTNGDGGATQPESNQWDSITFGTTSSGNVLDHVDVRYGGENVPGEIVVNTSQFSLINSSVSYSNTAGLFIQNADPTISGDDFKANAIGIRMDPNSNPAISNVTMISNGIDGVKSMAALSRATRIGMTRTWFIWCKTP